MPSPFAPTAPVRATRRPAEFGACATDAQLGFIRRLLAERDWQGTQGRDKHVSRAAVLNLVIGYAYNVMDDSTPPLVSRIIHRAVGRGAAYGDRVNAVLEYLMAEGTVAADFEYAYAPLTKDGASKLIEWLTTLPKRDRDELVKASAPVALPGDVLPEQVPAGRYAIETEDGAVNALAFYKVDRPTEGRWAGYVFVKLMQSDEEQRLSRAAAAAVLVKIAAIGAEVASVRYGHEIGKCGLCGRTLTNDESRARGIGPKCAAGAGW